MPETRVVNLKSGQPYDLYIGRANPRYRLAKSKWANPFKLGRDGTRDEVIAKYRAWLLERPELLAQLGELRGKVLACWCKPERCHGEVLAELADGTPSRD
jgi:hypothetical protein